MYHFTTQTNKQQYGLQPIGTTSHKKLIVPTKSFERPPTMYSPLPVKQQMSERLQRFFKKSDTESTSAGKVTNDDITSVCISEMSSNQKPDSSQNNFQRRISPNIATNLDEATDKSSNNKNHLRGNIPYSLDINERFYSESISKTRTQCFKTKMCHFFLNQKCSRGNDCVFAHSASELRNMPNLSKTKICIKWKKGQCKKTANKCCYAHGVFDLRLPSASDKDALSTASNTHSDVLENMSSINNMNGNAEDNRNTAAQNNSDGETSLNEYVERNGKKDDSSSCQNNLSSSENNYVTDVKSHNRLNYSIEHIEAKDETRQKSSELTPVTISTCNSDKCLSISSLSPTSECQAEVMSLPSDMCSLHSVNNLTSNLLPNGIELNNNLVSRYQHIHYHFHQPKPLQQPSRMISPKGHFIVPSKKINHWSSTPNYPKSHITTVPCVYHSGAFVPVVMLPQPPEAVILSEVYPNTSQFSRPFESVPSFVSVPPQDLVQAMPQQYEE